MRQLLRVGLLVLVAMSIVTPLLELLDRWDAAGLDTDGEFAAFALVFCLALVLLMCQLLSAPVDMTGRIGLLFSHPGDHGTEGLLPILTLANGRGSPPPLRI